MYGYNCETNGYGFMRGYGFFNGYGFIILILLVIVIIYAAYKLLNNNNYSSDNQALEYLKTRFAQGEITEEEYLRTKKTLKK